MLLPAMRWLLSTGVLVAALLAAHGCLETVEGTHPLPENPTTVKACFGVVCPFGECFECRLFPDASTPEEALEDLACRRLDGGVPCDRYAERHYRPDHEPVLCAGNSLGSYCVLLTQDGGADGGGHGGLWGVSCDQGFGEARRCDADGGCGPVRCTQTPR